MKKVNVNVSLMNDKELRQEIERAIRTTLVVVNKWELKNCVDKIIEVCDNKNTTKIFTEKNDEVFEIDVTECCQVGPIVNENYCPKCGKKIIRDEKNSK